MSGRPHARLPFEYAYNCYECCFASDNKSEFRTHLEGATHQKLTVVDPENPPDYVCTLCAYTGNKKQNFNQHCRTPTHTRRESAMTEGDKSVLKEWHT